MITKKFRSKIAIICSAALLAMAIYIPAAMAAPAEETKTDVEKMLETINGVYGQLYVGAEKNAVDDALVATKGLSDLGLVSEIWDRIADLPMSNNISNEEVLKLFAHIGSIYNPATGKLVETPASVKETLEKLVNLAGVSGPLTQQDLAAFALALEAEALDQLPHDYDELFNLANNSQALKDKFNLSVDAVMSNDNLNFVKLLKGLGVTTNDLKTVLYKIKDEVDPEKNAAIGLLLGYLRYNTPGQNFLGNPLEVSTDQNTRSYGLLRVLDITNVPATIFTWSSDNDNVTVNAGEYLVIKSTTNSKQTAIIEAKFNLGDLDSHDLLNGRTLFKQEVTVGNPNPNSGSIGGGGGGFPSAPQLDLPKDAQAAINDLKDELDSLFDGETPTDSNEGKKAVAKAVEEAIRSAATIDVSAAVKIEDEVAKLNVSTSDITAVFKKIKEIAAQANEALQAKDPNAAPVKVVATLDLGEVKADDAEIAIPQALIAAAKEQSIDVIAISVLGMIIEVDVNNLKDDAVLKLSKVADSVADDADSKRASAVYEINFFNQAGDKINEFSKPVQVKLLADVAGIKDPEYLVLMKIEDGILIPFGGKYNAKTGYFEAERNSFSSYAVVENLVSFKDIAGVQWADKAIRVSAAKGIINGKGNGAFDPQGDVTRAEFAALLVRTFGLENDKLTEKFADVNDGDWFQSYVAAAAHYGIVNGRNATTFDPNAKITRAEMATMAANALKKVMAYNEVADVEEALAKFSDAGSINAALKSSVALLTQEGIINGKGDGIFDPNGTSTRAQAAIIIYQLFNLR